MGDRTRHIRERFPDQKDRIDHLVAQDPEFLSVCEDYAACVDALNYWSNSKTAEAEIRVKEYRHICRELEDEVTEVIKERGAR